LALRANCTALLGTGAHGRTRSAACGRAAQTSGRELVDEARCARGPGTCAARRAPMGPVRTPGSRASPHTPWR